MNETPGANIDEARGEMKVMLPRREMSNHLRFSEKFKGISGSSCPSQPTISFSRSDTGRGAGARRAFLLLDVRLVAIRDIRLRVLFRLFSLERSLPSVRGPAFMEAWDC